MQNFGHFYEGAKRLYLGSKPKNIGIEGGLKHLGIREASFNNREVSKMPLFVLGVSKMQFLLYSLENAIFLVGKIQENSQNGIAWLR